MTTMQLIKRLREEIQAPLNIVKTAAQQAEPAGDYESALAFLKAEMTKRGEKLKVKSADRSATEGWVVAARSRDGSGGSITIFNCETDFVARSEKVVALAQALGQGFAAFGTNENTSTSGEHQALTPDKIDSLRIGSTSLSEKLTQTMSVFGEAMKISRVITTSRLQNPGTAIGIHCHGGPVVSGNIQLGRMGAIISVQSKTQDVKSISDELAREVVAQNPETIEEFWDLEKVGDGQGRTVRQWAGNDIEITAWTRLQRDSI